MFAAKDTLLTRPSGGYNLTRSLRFRSSASAYLNRTQSAPTSSQKATWSVWLKRGRPNTLYDTIYAGSTGSAASGDLMGFLNNAGNQFRIFFTGGTNADLITTQVFRDFSAWYHFVISVDTTQATASNRIRIYVNGVQITAFSTANYPSLNYNMAQLFANGNVNRIGYNPDTSEYFDGYMTEFHGVDGQALTPSSFGKYSIYNQWLPKKYAGTYGTNGFYLPFTNNASTTTLGYDFSPQGNNWTTNNISVTSGSTYDSMTDVPTLTSATAANYCTFNPLYPSSTPVDGNLSVVGDSNSRTVAGTMSSPTGKWYAEGVFTSGFATNGWFFIWDTSTPYVPGNVPATTGQTGAYYAGITGNIAKAITGTVTTIGTYSTWTNNDIIGMAFDADAGTISFYKNNTLQTTITDSGFIGRPLTFGIYYYAGSASMNFGQRPFTYTPPTGYLALNTFNL